MRYITDAKEAKQIDNISINEIGIPSLVLMERAALGVVEEIEKVYGKLSANACVKRKTEDNFLNSQRCKKSAELKNVNSKILVVAGMGNNGADGVAAARMLEHDGIKTAIKLVGNIEHASEEMKKQLEIAKNLGISFVTDMKKNEYDIIVDAIFGIGLSREITGEYREIIEKINGSNSYIVSVDISSGVDATDGKILGTAVKADMTVTFGNLKRGMLLFPGAVYSGEIKVKDIGFPDKAVESVSPKAYTFEKNDLYCMLPQRKMRTNKGSYGKVLVIAGCEAMCGACYFSAAAAYRAGCGLVRVLTAKENMQILKTKLPEAIVGSYDEEFEDGIDFTPKKEVEEAIGWADVIVIGPGLGKSIKAKSLVKRILKVKDKTVVIDADGLNILAEFIENKEQGLDNLGTNFILTPHLKEMSRLAGKTTDEIKNDMPYYATAQAECNIVLKDARTVVGEGRNIPDGKIYINTSGNNALATGGSGDVLSGIIAGIAAQDIKMKPALAAAFGVYVHGLTAEKYTETKSRYSMTASDIIDMLQDVMPR